MTAQHTLTKAHRSPTVDDVLIRLSNEKAGRDFLDPIASARTPLNLARIERLNDRWLGA